MKSQEMKHRTSEENRSRIEGDAMRKKDSFVTRQASSVIEKDKKLEGNNKSSNYTTSYKHIPSASAKSGIFGESKLSENNTRPSAQEINAITNEIKKVSKTSMENDQLQEMAKSIFAISQGESPIFSKATEEEIQKKLKEEIKKDDLEVQSLFNSIFQA